MKKVHRRFTKRLDFVISVMQTELHAGPNFATRPDPTWPADLSIKRKNHETPSHEYRVAFRILMKSLSTHPTSQINAVLTRMLHFSRAIFFLYDGIWFRHFAETRLRALQLVSIYQRHSTVHSWDQRKPTFRYIISQQWQHSMWWHRQRLLCACSSFTTSSSKTTVVVKFRRIDVFMREQVSEREVGYKRLMPVCRRSLLWNSATDDDIDGSISTVIDIHCPSRRLIYTENCMGDTEYIQLVHCAN